jgi:hypothetical protein
MSQLVWFTRKKFLSWIMGMVRWKVTRMRLLAVSADAGEGDDGQSIHDDSIVKTLRGRAIQIMKDDGVMVAKDDKKMALQLFPCVSFDTTLRKLIYDNIFIQVAGLT